MKFFKRVLCAAFAAILMSATFASCGKTVGSETESNEESGQKPSFSWTKTKEIATTKSVGVGETVVFDVDFAIGSDNYVGLDAECDESVVGSFVIADADKSEPDFTEDFFIQKGDKGLFKQIIDFYFEHVYDKIVKSVKFKNVGANPTTVNLKKIVAAEKEWYSSSKIFINDKSVKLGIDMNAGGAINYLEYLKQKMQQVRMPDGSVKTGVNYANTQDDAEIMYESSNLINEMDRGRLVQQSYYGISKAPYDCAQYIGMPWPYNPVQGGDYTGTSSQIVDFEIEENRIYVKVRPLDWAKVKSITPSYMENIFTIENGVVKVENFFTDWSGYNHNSKRDQELPAFYGIISLGTLVTYRGEKPFTGDELSYYPSLGNWVGDGRAYWTDITENWVAWVNEDDFGVGIYTPNAERILTGKVGSDKFSSQLSKADATTYTALIPRLSLSSYETFSYEYYLAIGDVDSLRNKFNEMAKTCKNEDIIEWGKR